MGTGAGALARLFLLRATATALFTTHTLAGADVEWHGVFRNGRVADRNARAPETRHWKPAALHSVQTPH